MNTIPFKAIIVLGPPGSGKGIHPQLLSEKFGFFLWETSAIIGRVIGGAKKGGFVRIEGKKYLFSEQAEIRDKGLIWDGRFVFYFSKKKLEELARDGKTVVLSGSPRNMEEAQRLLPLLEKLYGKKNIVAISLKLTAAATIWRNSHRRECQLATHSILYNQETKNLTKCPLDGSKLFRRKDDKPGAIKIRLKQYEEKTFLVFDFLRNRGIKIKEIKAEQPVVDVFGDILRALRK